MQRAGQREERDRALERSQTENTFPAWIDINSGQARRTGQAGSTAGHVSWLKASNREKGGKRVIHKGGGPGPPVCERA